MDIKKPLVRDGQTGAIRDLKQDESLTPIATFRADQIVTSTITLPDGREIVVPVVDGDGNLVIVGLD